MKKKLPFCVFSLSLFHISILVSSNYLLSFPLQVFYLSSNWALFTIPFVFLATDLTVRLFGKKEARKVVFLSMLPSLFLSYFISVVFAGGNYQGLEELLNYDVFDMRVSVASFLAYTLSQLIDIEIFFYLRKHKKWWLAPFVSTLIAEVIDTSLFFSVAFINSPERYYAHNWIEMGVLDASYKVFVSSVFFLPLYKIIDNFMTERYSFPAELASKGEEKAAA